MQFADFAQTNLNGDNEKHDRDLHVEAERCGTDDHFCKSAMYAGLVGFKCTFNDKCWCEISLAIAPILRLQGRYIFYGILII